jgi:4-hydroxyphenylpyruvate 3-dimethylallyltransferase
MSERIDISAFDEERFFTHLRETAAALGAGFDEAKVRTSLEVFAREFHTCHLQIKTTAKPGSGLHYRYYNTGASDQARRAQEAGLLESRLSPLLSVHEELLASCPGSTRVGLDFDAGFGVVKLWSLTGGVPMGELCHRVPSIPESIRASLGLLGRFGLERSFCAATDFQRRSMSIYFHWDMERRTEAWLQAFAREAGGEVPSSSTCHDILSTQCNWGCISTTFSWNQPGVRRWAAYSFDVPYGRSETGLHLPRLDDRLQVLLRAPTLNRQPYYILAWSFGPVGSYLKLEKDYARDGGYLMSRDTGVDLARDRVHISLPRSAALGSSPVHGS